MELFHPNLYDSNYKNDDDMYKQKAIALSGQKLMMPSTDPMLEVINSMQGKEVNTKSAIPDIFEYMNRFNGKKDSKKDDKKINENSVLQQQQLDAERRSEHSTNSSSTSSSTSNSTNSSTSVISTSTEIKEDGSTKVIQNMGDGSTRVTVTNTNGSNTVTFIPPANSTTSNIAAPSASSTRIATPTPSNIVTPSATTAKFELTPINSNTNLLNKANKFTSNITNKIYVMIFVIEKTKSYDEFQILCINDKEIFNGAFNKSMLPLVLLKDISNRTYSNYFKFNNISLTFVDIGNDRCYYYSYETDDLTTIVKTIGAKSITLKSYNDIVANPNSLNSDVQPFFDHFVKFHVPEELLDH
jgi:hypothetical protein